MKVARKRRLRDRKAAPPQLSPQLVLTLNQGAVHQLAYRVVTFQFHRSIRPSLARFLALLLPEAKRKRGPVARTALA